MVLFFSVCVSLKRQATEATVYFTIVWSYYYLLPVLSHFCFEPVYFFLNTSTIYICVFVFLERVQVQLFMINYSIIIRFLLETHTFGTGALTWGRWIGTALVFHWGQLASIKTHDSMSSTQNSGQPHLFRLSPIHPASLSCPWPY